MSTDSRDDDLLPEYDFSEAVVGKYAEQFQQGTNLVLLEPDLSQAFPDSKAVNAALRELLVRRSGRKMA